MINILGKPKKGNYFTDQNLYPVIEISELEFKKENKVKLKHIKINKKRYARSRKNKKS